MLSQDDKLKQAFQIGLCAVTIMTVAVACMNIPNNSEVIETKKQTRVIKQRTKEEKEAYRKNSPLNPKFKIDIKKAEVEAIEKIDTGLATLYGNSHSLADYQNHYQELVETFGSKFKKAHLPNPKDKVNQDLFESYIENTQANSYFENIDNVHHAKIISFVEYKSKVYGSEQYLNISFEFDYDLVKGKINSFKDVRYQTEKVMEQ